MATCVKCAGEFPSSEFSLPKDGLVVYRAGAGEGWPYVYVCGACSHSVDVEVHNNPVTSVGFAAMRRARGYTPYRALNARHLGLRELLAELVELGDIELELEDMDAIVTAWGQLPDVAAA